MSATDYHFVTDWRVEATCGEVADILREPLTLVDWWPSVYLAATELSPANADGVGRRVRLRTKGWLPYTLDWEFVVVESNYPHRFVLEASGDFVGRGVWTFVQDGPFVNVRYDWRIRADKPLLRAGSTLLAPLFALNHRWAMAQGESSLKLELARRRTTNAAQRASIPPPPGPVTYAGVALVGGAALVAGTLAVLLVRASRRRRSPD